MTKHAKHVSSSETLIVVEIYDENDWEDHWNSANNGVLLIAARSSIDQKS